MDDIATSPLPPVGESRPAIDFRANGRCLRSRSVEIENKGDIPREAIWNALY